MELRACIMGLVCALAMGATTIPAQAAPAGGTAALRADTPNIEKAAATCWWRGGRRHCAYGYGPRYRVYGYPERYRTGSGRWWSEMDREERGGRRR
jgi:hypothetical protein